MSLEKASTHFIARQRNEYLSLQRGLARRERCFALVQLNVARRQVFFVRRLRIVCVVLARVVFPSRRYVLCALENLRLLIRAVTPRRPSYVRTFGAHYCHRLSPVLIDRIMAA